MGVSVCWSLNTPQGPSGAKVSRLDMCRSMISLGKIAYQMWHNYPFSQRNKKKIAAGVRTEDDGEGGLDKISKRGGVGNVLGSSWNMGLGFICQI